MCPSIHYLIYGIAGQSLFFCRVSSKNSARRVIGNPATRRIEHIAPTNIQLFWRKMKTAAAPRRQDDAIA